MLMCVCVCVSLCLCVCVYAYVADSFETIADRNDVLVDTFNRRLEVSATYLKPYCR